MMGRISIRTVVTLVTALCVVTMFAGVGSAQLGVVDQDLTGELTESGGSGSGLIEVDAGDQGHLEGVGEVGGDVQEQEVNVMAEGSGYGPNDIAPPHVGLDCTLSPETVQQGLITEACSTSPFNPQFLVERPQSQAALVETLVRQAIKNPELAPSALSLVLLLTGLSEAVPTDQIPFDQIPFEQVPSDQIPVDQIPELNEQIPWDQIPNDQVPLGQPSAAQQLAR